MSPMLKYLLFAALAFRPAWSTALSTLSQPTCVRSEHEYASVSGHRKPGAKTSSLRRPSWLLMRGGSDFAREGSSYVIMPHSDSEWNEIVNDQEMGVPIVVLFGAPWCEPCKRITPKFMELANSYPSAVFVKINVDDLPGTADEANVTAMPTFKVVIDGQQVAEMLGANESRLEAFLAEHLSELSTQ